MMRHPRVGIIDVVHTGLGVGLILGGAAVLLAVAFGLRGRAGAPVCIALGVLGGGILAAGALLVQRHASPGDWIVAVGALALLMPVHMRVLLGPFGLKDSRLLAEEAPGA
jgi:hypothetical protein